MLSNLKVAFRQIEKNKVQYTLSVLGLAIGLLCFALVNYYIRNVYNASYGIWENKDRMGHFYIEDRTTGKGGSWLDLNDMNALIGNPVAGIEGVSIGVNDIGYGQLYLFERESGDDYMMDLKERSINRDYLAVFSVKPYRGSFDALQPTDLIIPRSVAERVFGDEDPIGKTVSGLLNGYDKEYNPSYRIAAICEDMPVQSPDRGMSYFLLPEDYQISDEYHASESSVMVLLEKGVAFEDVNRRLQLQFPQFAENNKNIIVKPLREQVYQRDWMLVVSILFLLGSLILVSAMINLLKFTVQNFLSRTRELSLRKSLGASFYSLFGLLASEILIVLTVGGIFTFLLTRLFVQLLYSIVPQLLMTNLTIDLNLLYVHQLQYLLALAVVCLLICWLTVWRVRKLNIISGVRGKGRGRNGVRNFFLCFQLIIFCLFLGASLGLAFTNYNLMKASNLTLSNSEMKDVLKIDLTHQVLNEHNEEIVSKVKSLNGVKTFMYARMDFLNVRAEVKINDDRSCEVHYIYAGEEFAEVTKLPVEGRMPHDWKEVALSNSLREALTESPYFDGSTVEIGGTQYHITGYYDRMPFISEKYEYTAIIGQQLYIYSQFYVQVYPGKRQEVIDAIDTIVRSYLPTTIPFEVSSFYQEINQTDSDIGASKVFTQIFSLLAIFSLLVTLLGVYSAIALDTTKRRKEVAIRKINGATRGVIYRLFGRLYVWLLAITFLLSIPILMLFFELIREADFGYAAPDSVFFWLSLIGIVSGVVFLTVAGHIRQVARLNPADVVKSE